MRVKVPKFLERETKIIAFLTFKQLALVGGTGLVLLVLYYILPKAIFFSLAVVVVTIIFCLIFVKIEGITLSKMIFQFFKYSFGSKNYLWQREKMPAVIKLLKKDERKKEELKEETPLKISPKSKLKKLSNKIEMGL